MSENRVIYVDGRQHAFKAWIPGQTKQTMTHGSGPAVSQLPPLPRHTFGHSRRRIPIVLPRVISFREEPIYEEKVIFRQIAQQVPSTNSSTVEASDAEMQNLVHAIATKL